MKQLLLILLMVLFSCSKERDLPMLLVQQPKYFIRVDSKVMLRSDPTIFNLDFKHDTVFRHWPNINRKQENFPYDTVLPKYNLKIIIDTTYDFYSKDFIFERLQFPQITRQERQKYGHEVMQYPSVKNYYHREELLQSKYVAAYPVLVYNQGDTDAYIGELDFFDFRMVQQALDIDGKWKAIEFQVSDAPPMSIVANFNYRLSPKHYLATSIIKYKGDFKTKIRVKFSTGNHFYYSNAVSATINRSQFDQSFIKSFLEERHRYEADYFQQWKPYIFLEK